MPELMDMSPSDDLAVHLDLTATLRGLANAHYRAELARRQGADQNRHLRQTIEDCDTNVERYQAALDAGGDPALIVFWISETSTERDNTTAALRASAAPPRRLTEGQITAIVAGPGSLLAVLRDADPRDRADLYSRIGLRMNCQPDLETLKAEVVTDDFGLVLNVCPRIDTNRYPSYRKAYYCYSTELVQEGPSGRISPRRALRFRG